MPSTNGSFDFCLAGCRLPVSPFVSACGSGGNGEDVGAAAAAGGGGGGVEAGPVGAGAGDKIVSAIFGSFRLVAAWLESVSVGRPRSADVALIVALGSKAGSAISRPPSTVQNFWLSSGKERLHLGQRFI